jgi:biopolymer transport protein ExbB/TolQ
LFLGAALGIEQVLMLVLFFYLALLLADRAWTRRRSVRATSILEREMAAAREHFLSPQEKEKRSAARAGENTARSSGKKKLTLGELAAIADDVDKRVRTAVARRLPSKLAAFAEEWRVRNSAVGRLLTVLATIMEDAYQRVGSAVARVSSFGRSDQPAAPPRRESPVFGRFDGTMPAVLMKELHARIDAAPKSNNSDVPDRLDASLEQSVDQIRRSIALSRWQIRWGIRALPAIGFIGTVRSMMLALGDADSIVRAVGNEARASAIADVSGTLGIAFSTTFFALLLGITLSLFDDRQKAEEARHVNEFFRVLGGFIRNLQFIERSDETVGEATER